MKNALFSIFLLLSGTIFLDAVNIDSESRPRLYSRDANSVDTGTGAFIHNLNLVSLQGARLLGLDLSYNSRITASKGDTGYGWSHQYEARIVGTPLGTVAVYLNRNIRSIFVYNETTEKYEPTTEQNRYDELERLPSGEWKLRRLSGTVLFFEGVLEGGAYPLQGVQDRNFHPITLTRQNGQISQIDEPISGRVMFLNYRPMGSPLLHYIIHGSNFRFLKYDAQDRLSRVYDSITLETAGVNSTPIGIPLGSQGVLYPIVVTSTDTDRTIRVRSEIDHPQPNTLQAFLISPSGKSVPINATSDRLFLDDFLGENPSGTWFLKVVDNVNDSLDGTITSFRIQIAEQSATWIEYDYDVFPYNRIIKASDSKGNRLFSNAYDSVGRTVFQDDGRDDNGAWELRYQQLSNGDWLTSVYDRTPARNRTRYIHDSDFRLKSIEDALQNTTRYSHFPNTGDLESIQDARGNYTRFTYDNKGRGLLTSITKGNGASTIFRHDEFAITDTDGNAIAGGPRGNLTSVTDELGQMSTFTYDVFNNIESSTNALDKNQSKVYDQNGQLIITVNKDGHGMEYEYEEGMLTAANIVDGPQEKVEYNDSGWVTKLVNAEGHASTITYDARGNVIEKSNALDQKIVTEYDHLSRRIRETDHRGSVTSYEYDGNGNIIRITNDLGETTEFLHDGEDRLIKVTDNAGHSSHSEYDAVGNIVKETDPEGHAVTHTFDEIGNKTASFGPNGTKLFEIEYDELNNPISQTDSRGNVSTFEYNELGQLISQSDNQNRKTQYVLDELGRTIKVIDPLGREFKKTYFDDDTVNTISNATDRESTFTYTAKNEVETVKTSSGHVTRYEYTGGGLLARYIPPSLLNAKEYSYDETDRIVKTAHTEIGVPDVIITYNESDTRITVGTQASENAPLVPKITQTFDSLGRRTSFQDANGDTIFHVYNSIGLPSKTIYPDNKVVSYAYDRASRLKTITDWAGRVTEHSWTEYNKIESISFPNGTTRVMDYDEAGTLLKRTDFDKEGGVIVSYVYSYDSSSFITSELLNEDPVAYEPQPSVFSYDIDNRLTQKNGIGVTYDPNGNVSAGPVLNQSTTFDWDYNNNLIRAGFINFTSDIENRLNGWQTETESVSFTTLGGAGGSQILVSKSSTGTTTRYVYGVGLAYEEVDGQIAVHHYDERGNTVALSGPTGVVSGTIAYSPFGEVIERTGNTDTIFQHGGLFGVVTAPNGLNYMRLRWYSPEMKRFLSLDSVIGDIRLPSTLNRYAYAGNNPINFNDPQGEFLNVIVGAVSGAVLGAVIELGSAAITGDLDWNRVAAAAIGGAVAGGIAGAGPAGWVGTVLVGVGAGAAGAFAETGFTALFNDEKLDWDDVGRNVAIGAVTGGATAGIGKGIGRIRARWKGPGKAGRNIGSNIDADYRHMAKWRGTTNNTPKNAIDRLAKRTTAAPLERAFRKSTVGNLTGFAAGAEFKLVQLAFEGKLKKNNDNSNAAGTGDVGQNGEYQHKGEYDAALDAADRFPPDTSNSNSSF